MPNQKETYMKRNAVVSAAVLLGIMILIGTQAIAVAQPNHANAGIARHFGAPVAAARSSTSAPVLNAMPQKRDVRYTVTQVGVLPGYESSYLPILGSINNGGFVAGYSYNGPLDTNNNIDIYLTSSAFIGDRRGRVTLLPPPGGYAGAFAFGLNDKNQVFGFANKLDEQGNLIQSPVVWDQYGNPTLLENLTTTPYYDVNAMNNRGDLVGEAYPPPDYPSVPVYWHQGRIAQLPLPNGAVNGWASAINDLGVIAGTVDYGEAPPAGTGEYHLYTWMPRGDHYVGLDLGADPGYEVWPQAINNLAQIAGGTWDGGSLRAFVWTFGHMKDLGTLPGGSNSWAWSINIRGQVVGQSDRSDQNTAAFVWQDDTIIDLNDVVPSGTPILTASGGINDVGQMAVFSWPESTTLSFILTPIARHSH
jgi:probable HAF family extracellular repeat protein